MKKRIVISTALLFLATTHARLSRLPDCFHVIGKEKNSTLFDPEEKKHTIVFIVVPAAAESAKKDIQAAKTLKKFTHNNTIQVPYSFFSADNPKKSTTPLCVYFDWIDSSPSTNHLNTPAQKLAEGLDYLHSLKSKCIVVTQGRGGLVFNAATHKLKKPVEVAIQLGTAIPKDTEKYKSFMPKSENIEQLYTFYSQQPFKYYKPTLHPSYTHKYTDFNHPNAYSVLLLINNHQPYQTELYSSLVGKNILELCYNIKRNFRVHRDLFASLSPLKKETPMIVAIRKPVKKKSVQRSQEVIYSNEQKKNLYTAWKRAPELNLSTGARIRSLHRFKKA